MFGIKPLTTKKINNLQKEFHNKQMNLGKKHAKQIKELETKHARITEYIQVTNANLLLRMLDNNDNDANDYETHGSQVDEILAMYENSVDIGGDLVKRIINISAALKIPNGLALEDGDNTPERAYIEKFMTQNQLNEGICTTLSKEAEKQGQILVQLLWDKEDNMVKTRYLPWNRFKYVVTPTGLNNMTAPYNITWEDTDSTPGSGKLSDTEIAFVSFNTRLNIDGTMEGLPALGSVLMRLDDIGRDLLNWKRSNKLYAWPTPHIQIEDPDQAESLASKIAESGWTTGQMLITPGKLTMVVPENYYNTIKESIAVNLQIISGAVGMSVAWLGFPDLMSNRATADSIGEPLEIVAANDITSWKSFYQQMFDNVINIRNINLERSKKLNVGIVKPRLKPMSDRVWQQLIRLYLPMAEQKLLSREGLQSKIPGFDLKEEKINWKKQLEEDESQMADEIRRSKLDNRADTGQQATGNRKITNEQG